MHDLLEGALQYEAKLLLWHCVGEGFFSLSTLNDRIECVELDVGCESDRPVTITRKTLKSKDNLLKQKGTVCYGVLVMNMTLMALHVLDFMVVNSCADVDPWKTTASHGWGVCSNQ